MIKDPTKRKEAQRRWWWNHHEERLQKQREWRKNNSQKYKEQNHQWFLANKTKLREYNRGLRVSLKKRIIDFYGGKCMNHMENYGTECVDPRVLQIDHVDRTNGSGRKQLGKINSYGLYRLIVFGKENPKKYQLLCANCNWIKRYENKEF